MIVPVILAGGVGSRLWPLSRQLNPKQFVSLASGVRGEAVAEDAAVEGGAATNRAAVDGRPTSSLFTQTLERLQGLPGLAPPMVICHEDHRFLVAEQLRQAGVHGARIVLEPCGRNTAPALTVAALLEKDGPQDLTAATDSVLLVLPADHLISDVAEFQRVVLRGVQRARKGDLVTFGISPAYPETGYGYIQSGESLESGDATGPSAASRVQRFVEKPDAETARAYLEAGDYYWNSGMFVLRADTWLEQVTKLAPEIASQCRQACGSRQGDGDFIRLDEAAFAASPSDSIDYAVMEKTDRAVVVPMSAGWNDLGAWSALWDLGLQDQDGADARAGNVTEGDVYCHDVRNSYIRSDSRLVAAIGLDNAVVVETPDAVLVAAKDRVQDVKSVVEWLQQNDRPEAQAHTLVYRPWGSYECLAKEPGFQVKRICVKPGAALSLQMHHHRAEHWVILSGVATVTCDERVFELKADQSTFIPQGSKHRLENKTAHWLELIEVQTGSYLGEDDIVRFDDVYGRV